MGKPRGWAPAVSGTLSGPAARSTAGRSPEAAGQTPVAKPIGSKINGGAGQSPPVGLVRASSLVRPSVSASARAFSVTVPIWS